MSNVLVLGGTRFFGKKLVEALVKEGHDVTIATRGNSPHPFGSRIKQIVVDRTSKEQLQEAVRNTQWDIVYDNICFSPNEAMEACEIFEGKTKKYVFTSTMSTYMDLGSELMEEEFNPYDYSIIAGNKNDFSYGEGKRQAEAVFFQRANFPVVAVRFPIVLGEDDYTKRLHFHIERVANGKVISFLNMDARMSYILSDDAASFLRFAGFSNIVGPYNVASTGTYSMKELMNLVEQSVGKRAKIALIGDEESRSPFAVPKDWYMAVEKSEKAGFQCRHLQEWLPALIQKLADDLE